MRGGEAGIELAGPTGLTAGGVVVLVPPVVRVDDGSAVGGPAAEDVLGRTARVSVRSSAGGLFALLLAALRVVGVFSGSMVSRVGWGVSSWFEYGSSEYCKAGMNTVE